MTPQTRHLGIGIISELKAIEKLQMHETSVSSPYRPQIGHAFPFVKVSPATTPAGGEQHL